MGEIEHWSEDIDHSALGEIEEVARRVAKEYVEELKGEPELRGSGVGLHGMRVSLPESQSVLRIGPSEEDWHGKPTEVMRIESPYPYPGPLRRLAYWLVLGWKWERP